MLDVCCALIFKAGRLLVVQRGAHPEHPNQWELPGGKIEAGETAVDCIRREILEELDLHVRPCGFLFPVAHDYGHKQIRLLPFVVEVLDGSRLNLQEHSDARWLRAHELYLPEWQSADRELLQRNEARILSYFREDDHNG